MFNLGKQRHIRLYPLTVVEGHEIDPVKLPDSKGELLCYCCMELLPQKVIRQILRNRSALV